MYNWIFKLLDEVRLEIVFIIIGRSYVIKKIENQEDGGLGA